INTAPAQGDVFVRQIEQICEALKSDGAQVSASCGLHVHTDARDFNYYDLRRLILLYEKIEKALYGMMPQSRRASNFCVPCGELYASAVRANRKPQESKENLIKTIYGDAIKKPERQSKWGHSRYYGLNLHSWFYRGTVETRLHTGTVNPQKIIAWGKLWASIMDTAMRMTEAQIETLTGSSLEILYTLAPDTETRDYITNRTQKWQR
ncbi:MAG: amidoligase family protein, partial [Acidobacteria bacterium]|nr:amidoligase family protein [Acidobacteriota bacterium]